METTPVRENAYAGDWRRVLVVVVLLAAALGATVADYYGVRGPVEITVNEQEEDLLLRKGATPVGLAFLWMPDVRADIESTDELKQMIRQVNRVFRSARVYFWLYESAIWENQTRQVHQPSEVGSCSHYISKAVNGLFPANELLVLIVRDIEGARGLTCTFQRGSESDNVWDYDLQASYVVLDLEAMRSPISYRVLTHQLLHVFLLPEKADATIYSVFPVDDLSHTVIVGSYDHIREVSLSFYVPLPENYEDSTR